MNQDRFQLHLRPPVAVAPAGVKVTHELQTPQHTKDTAQGTQPNPDSSGKDRYHAGMTFEQHPTTPSLAPFDGLLPEVVLDAVESLGFACDGRLLALNSYENRVWQVGIEGDAPIIAKFYRPKRWSDEAILEEHAFSLELAKHELPIVAPMTIHDHTLHAHQDHRFAVFKRFGGHAPEMADKATLEVLGRLMGRIHAVGSTQVFHHRPMLDPRLMGWQSVHDLLASDWIPMHLTHAFESTTRDLLTEIDRIWTRVDDNALIRLHGDCHPGNILMRDGQAHFVDLDDCRTGPAIQDLWMWLSGDEDDKSQQATWLIDAYRGFFDFDVGQLQLIEALRTLRMIHYQAWLARRWHDPAFPQAFGWFAEPRHWETVVEQLREQLDLIHQPPIQLQLN